MKRFIETMAPGWFAVVMGSSISAAALHLAADLYGLNLLSAASDFMHVFSLAAMIILGAAASARIVLFPRRVVETLKHPVEGAFYPTFPIAMLVMAAEWTIRGDSAGVVAALWWVGTMFVLISGYAAVFLRFSGPAIKLESATPAMFIPAVGLVVVPVAGAGLAEHAEGLMRELYFGINMMTMGAGVFMYIGLLALTMFRHFIEEPIVGKLTPTLFIHSAPLSVIPLSAMALLHALGDAVLMKYAFLIASLFLGAAVWVFILACALVFYNWRNGRLPFALSWWAFVFPVGGMSVLALRLSSFMKLELLPYLAGFLLAVLAALWTAAAVGTARGLAKGEIIPRN